MENRNVYAKLQNYLRAENLKISPTELLKQVYRLGYTQKQLQNMGSEQIIKIAYPTLTLKGDVWLKLSTEHNKLYSRLYREIKNQKLEITPREVVELLIDKGDTIHDLDDLKSKGIIKRYFKLKKGN